MIQREQIRLESLEIALGQLREKTLRRLNEKGLGGFASNHEIYGVLAEELYEYLISIHEKHPTVSKIEELKDIAIAAIFGIMSLQNNSNDW